MMRFQTEGQSLKARFTPLSTINSLKCINEHERLLTQLAAATNDASPTRSNTETNARIRGYIETGRARIAEIHRFIAEHRRMYKEFDADKIQKFVDVAAKMERVVSEIESSLPVTLRSVSPASMAARLSGRTGGAVHVDYAAARSVAAASGATSGALDSPNPTAARRASTTLPHLASPPNSPLSPISRGEGSVSGQRVADRLPSQDAGPPHSQPAASLGEPARPGGGAAAAPSSAHHPRHPVERSAPAPTGPPAVTGAADVPPSATLTNTFQPFQRNGPAPAAAAAVPPPVPTTIAAPTRTAPVGQLFQPAHAPPMVLAPGAAVPTTAPSFAQPSVTSPVFGNENPALGLAVAGRLPTSSRDPVALGPPGIASSRLLVGAQRHRAATSYGLEQPPHGDIAPLQAQLSATQATNQRWLLECNEDRARLALESSGWAEANDLNLQFFRSIMVSGVTPVRATQLLPRAPPSRVPGGENDRSDGRPPTDIPNSPRRHGRAAVRRSSKLVLVGIALTVALVGLALARRGRIRAGPGATPNADQEDRDDGEYDELDTEIEGETEIAVSPTVASDAAAQRSDRVKTNLQAPEEPGRGRGGFLRLFATEPMGSLIKRLLGWLAGGLHQLAQEIDPPNQPAAKHQPRPPTKRRVQIHDDPLHAYHRGRMDADDPGHY